MSEAADQQKSHSNDDKTKDKKIEGLPKEEELVSELLCLSLSPFHYRTRKISS